MPGLTVRQRGQLLHSIVEYLYSLRLLPQDEFPFDSSAFFPIVDTLRHVVGPHGDEDSSQVTEPNMGTVDLEAMFLACEASQPSSSSPKTPSQLNEHNFQRYVNTLESRGYFANVSRNSAEYQQLLDNARVKFDQCFGQKKTSTAASSLTTSESSSNSTLESQETTSSSDPYASLTPEEKLTKAEEVKTQGNTFLSSHSFDQAVGCYSTAISLDPNNAIYYSNRAAAYSSLGKYLLAIEDSKKALEINPNYAKAYSRLGLAYFALGRYREAIDEGYKKYLELDPDNVLITNAYNMAQSKLASQESAANLSTSSTNESTNTQSTPNGSSNPLSNLSSMFSSLMNQNQGAAASATGGSGNPSDAPNFSTLLSNPQFMQMAQQVASNPQFMQMAEQVASNPSILNSLGSLFSSQSNPSNPSGNS